MSPSPPPVEPQAARNNTAKAAAVNDLGLVIVCFSHGGEEQEACPGWGGCWVAELLSCWVGLLGVNPATAEHLATQQLSNSATQQPMTILSVLDQAPIAEGSTGAEAVRNSIDLARFAEELGYERYWVAEHHGTPALACA